jgi:hypothetical protein
MNWRANIEQDRSGIEYMEQIKSDRRDAGAQSGGAE